MTTWPPRYGPFDTLYADGEGGLNNADARTRLAHAGTKLINRASGQHAHYVEARNAILRDTMHKLEAELVRQGIEVDFNTLSNKFSFELVHGIS